MITQLLSGIYFLAVATFGLYAMYKNDEVVTNKWLFLCGWFLWGCMMCISVNIFLSYSLGLGYLTKHQLDLIYKGFTSLAYSPASTIISSIGSIFYSMYLFSLRKKCMEVEYLPRTFRIWVIRLWRKIFKRHIYYKQKIKTNYEFS